MAAACRATYLFLSGGSTLTVRVARSSQSEEECVANVVAALEGAVAKLPKQWAGVKSLFLKTSESAALPFYQAAPDLPSHIS